MAVAMTNSKKDSTLKVINYPDGVRFGAGSDIIMSAEVLAEHYITKEESDRRVLEGRIEEVTILRDSAKRAGDPRSTVELNTIVRAGNDRIAELRELLKGGEE